MEAGMAGMNKEITIITSSLFDTSVDDSRDKSLINFPVPQGRRRPNRSQRCAPRILHLRPRNTGKGAVKNEVRNATKNAGKSGKNAGKSRKNAVKKAEHKKRKK
ncbi:hypothetical protein C1H46_002971 [Malus baccata]|uniref:Uncharacterized protein n=1 Tax=Malus baccata TaxID=106549 RepID=A0A540NK48_MALBA|nr:hypothetical protein C1H46_002971 [Malus baccata]